MVWVIGLCVCLVFVYCCVYFALACLFLRLFMCVMFRISLVFRWRLQLCLFVFISVF